jgi:TetR/AcrR family transcriptional regulator of autoinduction and epiphytic fitness
LPSAAPRGRGEVKRRAIVAAATQAFLTHGSGAASVDAISAQAGVSKRTLYNHFPGKRELFRAVVEGLYADWAAAGDEEGLDGLPVEAALAVVARRLLSHLRRPEILGLLRLLVAEQGRFPELAQDFHAAGKGRAVAVVAACLARGPGGSAAHATLAAQMFLGAIKEVVFWPTLLGLPAAAQDDVAIARAIRMILPVAVSSSGES